MTHIGSCEAPATILMVTLSGRFMRDLRLYSILFLAMLVGWFVAEFVWPV